MKKISHMLMALSAIAYIAGCTPTEEKGVKISSFGYDSEDSTRFIQAAFDSGKRKLILDKQAGPWYTLPLKMRSNTELIIEPGVELVAKRGAYKDLRDYLLELPYITNVVIRGGAGSTLRMWKKDYQGPDYKHGEWRYALRIFHADNVLVEGLTIAESGGDGIGVSGKDITIRNCVMDKNHRQGMSIFSAENLLVENCIMSNTTGTPPAAGVDFEPDKKVESLKNCVMRNCQFINNDGHGIEIFLNNLRSTSDDVSITFENCRTVGNKSGAHIWAVGSKRTVDFVGGKINFINCSFESSERPGIGIESLPDKAFDVSFENCIVSNVAENAGADVAVGVTNMELGAPEGLTLKNLKIFQTATNDYNWFSYAPQGIGPLPKRNSGDITVFSPGKAPERVTIDSKWIEKNMQSMNGGKPLPKRIGMAASLNADIVDKKPGELVPLAPITHIGGLKAVFYADRPGKVRFVARQVIRVAGRKPDTQPMVITQLDKNGKRGKSWRIARPADKSKEFTFDAPAKGFYALEVGAGGTRFQLEKSSVPVAIDVTTSSQTVAALRGNPFSLWFQALPKTFTIMLEGGTYYRFAYSLEDGSGKTVAERKIVEDTHLQTVTNPKTGGMYKVNLMRSPKATYDWIDLDLFGAPGFIFLTDEKYWRMK
jgi:hypothetical protein